MVLSVGSPFIVPPQLPAARPAAAQSGQQAEQAATPQSEELTDEQRAAQALQEAASGENESSPFSSELTEEEERIVRELQQTDREVRAHEQAHKSVAGPYAGPIQYDTVTGPDGREYAVGGEVQIDTSPVPGNPQATIQKLETVIRAALAPADPSPQDFAVARAAQQALAQARRELQEQREAEAAERRSEEDSPFQADEFNPNAPADEISGEQRQQLSTLIESLNTVTQAQNPLQRGSTINISS